VTRVTCIRNSFLGANHLEEEWVSIFVQALLLADREEVALSGVKVEVGIEGLSAVPVPLVDLSHLQVEQTGQMLHLLLRPVGIFGKFHL